MTPGEDSSTKPNQVVNTIPRNEVRKRKRASAVEIAAGLGLMNNPEDWDFLSGQSDYHLHLSTTISPQADRFRKGEKTLGTPTLLDKFYLDNDGNSSQETTPRQPFRSRRSLNDSSSGKQINENKLTVENNCISLIDSDDDNQSIENDEQTLDMKPVERINVNDPKSKDTVTECRRNGIPIVLVGHKGWVNFARLWLTGGNGDEDIDFSKLKQSSYMIDEEKMVAAVGTERVPVSVRNYRDDKPTPLQMKLDDFLAEHWNKNPDSTHYLHQWQFTRSDTASSKLCNSCKPLPNNILGVDILKYYNVSSNRYDNPYQYLFMGNSGCRTRLHVDHGGLDISIAPITGRKECILVHRDDGYDCFYDSAAKLDDIDLEDYPLMSQARIWKTIIKPGEILLLPQGTYHECRNVTPCLSYSRLILDTVNLLPFYRSMVKGDANEIPHAKIMWNCAVELIDEIKTCVKKDGVVSDQMALALETLKTLRHYFKEMAINAYNNGKANDVKDYDGMVADINSVEQLCCQTRNNSSRNKKIKADESAIISIDRETC